MADFTRTLTIEIFNASGTDITVNWGMLTGGSWAETPAPGTVIAATKEQAYVNGVPNTLTAFGGQLMLAPTSGGTINPVWDWPASGPVSGSVNTTAISDLAVSVQFSNVQTNNATMQVLLMNGSTSKKLVATIKNGGI